MPRILPALLLLPLLLASCTDEEPDTLLAPTALLADEHFVIEAVDAQQLVREVQRLESDLVVVNFWASWCLPCRKEFPEFIRYGNEHDDVALRFVSLDFDDEVELAADFLREQGITGSTYMKTGGDQEFINSISPAWTGAIPATAVYDSAGNLLTFWEGMVDYEDLSARIDAVRANS